jgi:hypothetical protein
MSLHQQIAEKGHNIMPSRAVFAKRIKELMHDWTENTLALAAELSMAAETFPPNPKRPDSRPGFAFWARQQTGLSTGQIISLLRVHKKLAHRSHGRIKMSQQVMRLLIAKEVPESARQEVFGRAERGEHIAPPEAKKIIAKHKLPTPKAANQLAKEEGRPVFASDGNIYFGTDPARAKEGQERRAMVFGVRDALNHLGNIHLTGREFLDYAFPHQLWSEDEASVIKKALRWLTDLDRAWDARS